MKRPSRTAHVVERIVAAIGRTAKVETDLIDLADAAPVLFRALRADELDEAGRAIVDAVEAADVLVVGSPVYRAPPIRARSSIYSISSISVPCRVGA